MIFYLRIVVFFFAILFSATFCFSQATLLAAPILDGINSDAAWGQASVATLRDKCTLIYCSANDIQFFSGELYPYLIPRYEIAGRPVNNKFTVIYNLEGNVNG